LLKNVSHYTIKVKLSADRQAVEAITQIYTNSFNAKSTRIQFVLLKLRTIQFV